MHAGRFFAFDSSLYRATAELFLGALLWVWMLIVLFDNDAGLSATFETLGRLPFGVFKASNVGIEARDVARRDR